MEPFDGSPSWKVTRVLHDGTEVTIRGISAEDREALRAAYRETSAATRYSRFLGSVSDLTEETLTYLTCVDQKNHIALVAVTTSPDLKTERGLGVARLIRIEPGVAEAAITVADNARHNGLGVALAEELQRAGRARGVRTIRADVLATNTVMRGILESAGAELTDARGGPDTVSYDLAIAKDVSEQRLVALALLRGAAQTMAIALRKLVPPTR